jgi:hypothetical protein
MSHIEEVKYEDKTFALVLRHNYAPEGVNFVTPQDNPLQLGVLRHQRGTEVRPHIHRNLPRTISQVQEVIHIEYGKVEAKFYDTGGKELGSVVLNTGDTILLLSGGHGFSVLEDSKLMEIKQGPYYGPENDKERLNVKQESEKQT